MEVNFNVSNLMREWLTGGTDRGTGKCKKAKSCASPAVTFQPRPERLGLGATPHTIITQSCTMNKIRKNINKRIKSAAAVYQEDSKITTNGHLARQHMHSNREMNVEEEGSRSLAFSKCVDGKTSISGDTLKVHKKRKRKVKGKQGNAAWLNGTQDDNFATKSSTSHLSATAEDNVSCVADTYEVKNLRTHKSCKKWNLRLRYGKFQPQTNCTRLRWRKCFVKRIP